MQRFDALIYCYGTRFWSKFAGSRQDEIFLETKTKMCYTAKSPSLSIVEFSAPQLPPCSYCRFKKKFQHLTITDPIIH